MNKLSVKQIEKKFGKFLRKFWDSAKKLDSGFWVLRLENGCSRKTQHLAKAIWHGHRLGMA
jgi:hypothetical protein